MEPRARPEEALSTPPETTDGRDTRLVWRFRLLAVSLGLVALAFVQTPGRIVTDTKLDLVVDPAGFLARSLTLWDPVGAFGQVQNQAYGYLFPMGPFFLLGNLAEIPPWVIQRAWWSLLLVVAFLGMVKLCGAMRIGAPWARVVAGLAYALSPRILSVIGPSSIEVWPMALAPWVLVPLVIGLRRRDPRVMAAASAVAVMCVGGVNAVATFAVIPLGALWLLLAPAGPRRRSMMLWWPLFVLLGTLWWLVPLFLLGAYSPPFLDYIESASTTTFAATLFDALRGTTNWVPYVDGTSVAGNELLRSIGLIVNGAVVVALGLVGIAGSRTSHRRFLLSGLLLGLVLVTLGHTGAAQGWGAGTFQEALDAVLSPVRNTHKFDLIVRIPLVLGFAHALSGLGARLRDAEAARTLRTGLAVLGVAAVVGATVPAWTGHLANRGAYEAVPGYWEEAAAWLADQEPDQRALMVPASAFGDYLWGRTGDDVIQPLATSPWAVRNAIPLAQGGNILTLDAIERALASGEGSDGLRRYLERTGVRYLVVRNDLALGSDHTDNERVYATLASTPGVASVARFGPVVGSDPVIESEDGTPVFVNGGWQAERPAVEIFSVGTQDRSPATVQNLDETPVVVGGPSSLLTLDELGATPDAILAGDVADRDERPSRVVLTDGARRQEAAFGRVEQNRSASLAENDPYTLDRPVHDYRVSENDDDVSVPRLVGATSLTASSSQSDAGSPGPVLPGTQPWSAFDGDPRTAWRAGAGDADTSWVAVRFGGPTAVSQLRLTVAPTADRTRRLTVSTDVGSVDVEAQPGVPVVVALPTGATRSVRISGGASSLDPLTLSDVTLPGIEISRPLVMPTVPNRWGAPDQIVMSVDQAYRSGCLRIQRVERCLEGQERWGEDGRTLDREVTLGADASYPLRLQVTAVGGDALDTALQDGRLAGVRASSYAVQDPRNSAIRAIDGDPTTGWVAAEADQDPTLTLRWVGARRVGQVRVATSSRMAASVPEEATLRFSGGRERSVTFRDGVATFEPVRAKGVEIHFGSTEDRRRSDALGGTAALPVGVSEVSLGGRRSPFPQVLSTAPIGRCGDGPAVEVDGRRYETRVRAAAADILAGGSLGADVCGLDTLDLAEGTHRIRVVGNDVYRPETFVLGADQEATTPTAAQTPTWTATQRSVTWDGDGAGEKLVTVAENLNAGWRGGADSEAVQVNGWQQGWTTTADDATLALDYAPSGRYRVALVVGGLLAAALLVLALVGRRRSGPRPSGRARGAGVGAVVVLAAASGLLAGTPGLVIALAGLLTGLGLRRVVPGLMPWLVPVPVMVAMLAYVVRPWGSDAGWAGELAWPQLVAVGSLGLLVAALLDAGRLRKRWRSRIEGSSTSR